LQLSTVQISEDAALKSPARKDGDANVHYSNAVTEGDLLFDKKSPLTITKKVYEFYTAPITKFWMNTVCFSPNSFCPDFLNILKFKMLAVELCYSVCAVVSI
jgi:hypothetical protein